MSEFETTPADLDTHKAFEKARQRGKSAKSKAATTPGQKPASTATGSPPKADPQQQVGCFMDEGGLWYIGKKGDVFLPAAWVCSPFTVKWRARSLDGLRWCFILEITDRDGAKRTVMLMDADIGGQDGGWHRVLSDAGLPIHPKRRGELGQYLLLECDSAPRARTVEKTGLHGDCYVLPHRTIGKSDEPFLFTGQGSTDANVESGTAEEWRDAVGRLCPGNSRLVLSVAAALAAPLLPLSGISDSGGFHVYGESSKGKTTSMVVAASVNGRPAAYILTWRNTGNAVEGVAARHNHRLACFDEIGAVGAGEEREIGSRVMMVGNGSGKGRMTDNATLRDRLTWQLLWLSTGEHAMSHYLEGAGLKPDAGMEVRQLDIPADARHGFGLFEQLHGHKDARALAEALRAACDKYHGAAGIAWLEHVTAHLDELRRDLPGEVARAVHALTPGGAESQVLRALRRFALLAVAGEYASRWGVTGWPQGTATAGIKTIVDAWLARRGGAGNMERQRMVQRLQEFLGKHWSGRFVAWDRATDSHSPGKDGVVGLRREIEGDWQFYITAEGWAEIYRGMDPVAAAHALSTMGMLRTDAHGKPNLREYLPGLGRRRCYQPVPDFFQLADDRGGASDD